MFGINFDLATAYLIVGILYLLVPSLVWLLLSQNALKMTAWWCGGGTLIGMGTLFWTLVPENVLPTPYYGLIFAAFVAPALLLKIKTLRSILNVRFSSVHLFGFLVAYLCGEVFMDYRGGAARGLFFLVTQICMYGYLVWLAWRVHVEQRIRSVLWICAGYVLAILVMLLMPYYVIEMGNEAFRKSTPAALLALVAIVIAFTNHIAYMGLVLENTWRDQKSDMFANSAFRRKGLLSQMLLVSQQERILANVSRKLMHEIRQPLTSLSSSISLLKRGIRDERLAEMDMHALINRMDNSLFLANQVVSQLKPMLQFRDAEFTKLDLLSLIDEAVSLVDTVGVVEIRHQAIDSAPLTITGNRIEMIQVLINLFRNAMQACAQLGVSPNITVDLQPQGGVVHLVLTDNGPGFSDEALKKLGKEIYTSRPEGIGLGAWICHEIITRHGGSLNFANQHGAEVSITLPLVSEESS